MLVSSGMSLTHLQQLLRKPQFSWQKQAIDDTPKAQGYLPFYSLECQRCYIETLRNHSKNSYEVIILILAILKNGIVAKIAIICPKDMNNETICSKEEQKMSAWKNKV